MQSAEVLAFLALFSFAMLWISMRYRKRERLVSDLPNSKVQGVFIGLVELNVTAESEKPLTGFLSGQACVDYDYQVQEQWKRPVTETYTDDKGQQQTRTKEQEGWETIAKGGEREPFYGKDDTGVILINPEGAKFERMPFFDHTVSRADPMYLSKAPLHEVKGTTGIRRFTESGLALHAPLFIVGQARERQDVVAPEIAASKDAALFLISAFSKKLVQTGYSLYSWLAWGAGLLFAAAAGYFGHDQPNGPQGHHAGLIIALVLYLGIWGVAWAWMVFNSLVGLRARVRQGWSLIDVELKRRNDLIPGLVSAVSALSAHEAGIQETVAALRSQQTATPPGQAGTDIGGLAPTLRVVAERYPNLVAQESFSRLQKQLVETEQRIALARGYYNDIATQFATRVEQVPDRWLAGVGGLHAEPLLEAAGFERAPVKVNLASA